MNLEPLIRFYHELTPESVARFPEFYSVDAWFKDPFKRSPRPARHPAHLQSHVPQVDEPRFVVTEQVADAGGTMLIWDRVCN